MLAPVARRWGRLVPTKLLHKPAENAGLQRGVTSMGEVVAVRIARGGERGGLWIPFESPLVERSAPLKASGTRWMIEKPS